MGIIPTQHSMKTGPRLLIKPASLLVLTHREARKREFG